MQIVFGGILLVAGRRLYWLLAAGAGFVVGLLVAQTLFREQSETVMLAIALVVAVIFAVLAVVGQKFIIGLVGFVAGGVALVRVLQALDLAPAESNTVLLLALFVVGGIAGAILLSKLFGLGLVVLSSLIGAELVLAGLRQLVELPGQFPGIALIVLVGLGLIVQMGIFRRR